MTGCQIYRAKHSQRRRPSKTGLLQGDKRRIGGSLGMHAGNLTLGLVAVAGTGVALALIYRIIKASRSSSQAAGESWKRYPTQLAGSKRPVWVSTTLLPRDHSCEATRCKPLQRKSPPMSENPRRPKLLEKWTFRTLGYAQIRRYLKYHTSCP